MNKYNNKKVVVDNIIFDSKMESLYYIYLNELIEKGEVLSFDRQVPFLLQEKFKYQGKTIREIKYIADYVVRYEDHTEVIDIKGVKTPDFSLKWKLVKYLNRDLIFKCIRKKGKEWVEI